MLCTIRVTGALLLALVRVPQLVHLVVLRTLKAAICFLLAKGAVKTEWKDLPIQEDPAERLVEILAESSDSLLQNIH